jgi:hypothetical protein
MFCVIRFVIEPKKGCGHNHFRHVVFTVDPVKLIRESKHRTAAVVETNRKTD